VDTRAEEGLRLGAPRQGVDIDHLQLTTPQHIHVAQQRLREKTFLAAAGLPVPRFVPVRSLEDLGKGLGAIGIPAVLKQAAWGYDGKGQVLIEAGADAASAWAAVGRQESILEGFVDFVTHNRPFIRSNIHSVSTSCTRTTKRRRDHPSCAKTTHICSRR